jgi:hypothetical protein
MHNPCLKELAELAAVLGSRNEVLQACVMLVTWSIIIEAPCSAGRNGHIETRENLAKVDISMD